MATTEKLPPNFHKLDIALRSIGYSFEAAVADVIDNSIEANSRNILVRMVQRDDNAFDLAIIDDGDGMSSRKLKEAMRFGSDLNKEIKRLGKFGLGLKLASLSQGKELKVISRQNGVTCARGWLEDGIKEGFATTEYTEAEANDLLASVIPDRPVRHKGTVVIWNHLYRIGYHVSGMDEHSEKLASRLQNHLRVSFHRFLSGEAQRIRITIDVFSQSSKKAGIPCAVKALNPFGYKQTGRKGYPKKFVVEAEGAPTVKLVAHIWPPNSDLPEYKLPGGANSRQGFYFYRQNRLIQSGGWSGLREVEPHFSLARVEINITPEMDLSMSLDVKKSEVHLPPALQAKIMDSLAKDRTVFSQYLSEANDAYRSRAVTDKELPLVPAHGMPSEMREIFLETLRLPQTSRHRKIRFEWETLEPDLVFWVDREEDTIILNSRYRQILLHGLPGSATDLPAIKCLLFLISQDAFRSERMGSKIRERLRLANLMLKEAVRHERTGK